MTTFTFDSEATTLHGERALQAIAEALDARSAVLDKRTALLERRERKFVFGAFMVIAVLLPMLVVIGTMLNTLIQNAPVVKAAATSCATFCCRPLNEKEVTK